MASRFENGIHAFSVGQRTQLDRYQHELWNGKTRWTSARPTPCPLPTPLTHAPLSVRPNALAPIAVTPDAVDCATWTVTSIPTAWASWMGVRSVQLQSLSPRWLTRGRVPGDCFRSFSYRAPVLILARPCLPSGLATTKPATCQIPQAASSVSLPRATLSRAGSAGRWENIAYLTKVRRDRSTAKVSVSPQSTAMRRGEFACVSQLASLLFAACR